MLQQLLPRYVATRLFHAVLEGKASEESSRMVAMKNATENAEELIDDLTLAYNKVAPVQHHPRDDPDRNRRASALSRTQEDETDMASAAPAMAEGRVIQITGPVVDIEFPAGELPAILNAVEIDREGGTRSSARSPSTSATTGSGASR